LKLDHIAIGVKNLDSVVSQLEKNLGFAVVRKGVHYGSNNGLVFVKEPKTGIQFEIVDRPDKEGTSFMHFAFQVDDIDAELERLKNEGYKVEREPHDIPAAGIRSALLDTNQGIKVQLLTYL